jgi:hypothetical protein
VQKTIADLLTRCGLLAGAVAVALLMCGGVAQAADAPARAPDTLVLADGGGAAPASRAGDDLKDVGKCAWNGTKAGLGPWKALKKLRHREKPELTDMWTVPPNPWIAGGTIIACSVFSARPAG